MAIQPLNEMKAIKSLIQAVAMVIDHSAPSPLEGVSALHHKDEAFAGQQGIKFLHIVMEVSSV